VGLFISFIRETYMKFALLEVHRLAVTLERNYSRTCQARRGASTLVGPVTLAQPVDYLIFVTGGDGEIALQVSDSHRRQIRTDEAGSALHVVELPSRRIATVGEVAYKAALVGIATPDRIIDAQT
jgi:hypothetical protein